MTNRNDMSSLFQLVATAFCRTPVSSQGVNFKGRTKFNQIALESIPLPIQTSSVISSYLNVQL